MLVVWIVVVVVPPAPADVVVVAVVVGVHGVVRGRHLRTNVSRSLRGLVPLGAVAFTPSRSIPRFLLLLTETSTNVPQPEPWSELGRAPASWSSRAASGDASADGTSAGSDPAD